MEGVVSIIKKKSNVTRIILLLLAILAFFVVGSQEPVIQRDTSSYIVYTQNDAVMPIYPMFYCLMRDIFGEVIALNAMMYAQGFISLMVTIVIALYVTRLKSLTSVEAIITYGLLLLPYLVYLPDYVLSQVMLTEAIAVPLLYVAMFFLLKGMYENSVRSFGGAIFISGVLYLIRTQMIIFMMVVGIVVLIYGIVEYRYDVRRIVKLSILAFFALLLVYWGAVKFTELYRSKVAPHLFHIEQSVELEDEDNIVSNTSLHSSQMNRLLWNRTICLISDEDSSFLESEGDKKILSIAISSVRNENASGLICDNPIDWSKAWDDQGLISERNVEYVISGLTEYYEALYPDLDSIAVWSMVMDDLNMFSTIVIKHHVIDLAMLYLRLFCAGIQASVFYQPRGWYVLSEIISLLICMTALVVLVLHRKRRDIGIILLRLSVIGIVIFAAVVSAVQVPLQRYLIYFQGLFYAGMYLTLKEDLANVSSKFRISRCNE